MGYTQVLDQMLFCISIGLENISYMYRCMQLNIIISWIKYLYFNNFKALDTNSEKSLQIGKINKLLYIIVTKINVLIRIWNKSGNSRYL